MATVYVLHEVSYDNYEFPKLIGASSGPGKCLDIIDARMASSNGKLTFRLTEINTFNQEFTTIREMHRPYPNSKPFWRSPCYNEAQSNRHHSPEDIG